MSAGVKLVKVRQGDYIVELDGYVIGETRIQRDGSWMVIVRDGPADDDFRDARVDFRKREGAVRQIVDTAYQPPEWCHRCGCNVARSCVCARDCQHHPKGREVIS